MRGLNGLKSSVCTEKLGHVTRSTHARWVSARPLAVDRDWRPVSRHWPSRDLTLPTLRPEIVVPGAAHARLRSVIGAGVSRDTQIAWLLGK